MEQAPRQSQRVVRKAHFKKLSFAYGFRPIYCFSRVFGLMPFSITHVSNVDIQEPRVSDLDWLWFMISTLTYSSLAFLNYQSMKLLYDPSVNLSVLVLGDKLLLVTVLICGVLIMVINMCNRFKLVNILNNFTAFDNEVGSNLVQRAFPPHIKYQIVQYRCGVSEFVLIIRGIIETLG